MSARAYIGVHNIEALDLDPDVTISRHNDGRVSIGVSVGQLTMWFWTLAEMDLFAAELVRIVGIADAKIHTLDKLVEPASDTPHGA